MVWKSWDLAPSRDLRGCMNAAPEPGITWYQLWTLENRHVVWGLSDQQLTLELNTLLLEQAFWLSFVQLGRLREGWGAKDLPETRRISVGTQT